MANKEFISNFKKFRRTSNIFHDPGAWSYENYNNKNMERLSNCVNWIFMTFITLILNDLNFRKTYVQYMIYFQRKTFWYFLYAFFYPSWIVSYEYKWAKTKRKTDSDVFWATGQSCEQGRKNALIFHPSYQSHQFWLKKTNFKKNNSDKKFYIHLIRLWHLMSCRNRHFWKDYSRKVQ